MNTYYQLQYNYNIVKKINKIKSKYNKKGVPSTIQATNRM